MAYEMVMPYHLHMPSYFLETFTEYPNLNAKTKSKQKTQIMIIFYFFLFSSFLSSPPLINSRANFPSARLYL